MPLYGKIIGDFQQSPFMKIHHRVLAILMATLGLAMAERPYVNDKVAPENRKDLEVIQKSLIDALPKARAATVCLEVGEGSGSGVIVSADGLILTAAHVAMGTGRDITVVMEDGRKLKGETLGVNAATDCAMARITEAGTYPFVELDRNDTTKLGDWVFSLGHSGGYDKERGSVVRIGRIGRMAQSTWQSDCNLIGGDSGGPLFNLEGVLVGIHSRVGNIVVNNHVPMREFLEHWDAMQKAEFIGEGPFAQRSEKGSGFLGIGSKERATGGLDITKVGKDSPAEKAGIKPGDVLLKINGTEMKTKAQVDEVFKELAAYDKITLELLRGDKTETLTVRLGER